MSDTARRATLPLSASDTVYAMQQRRTGRPSKGDRKSTTVRLPVGVRALVDERAAAEGLDVTDYLTRVIAHAHGQTAPAYCYPREQARQAA